MACVDTQMSNSCCIVARGGSCVSEGSGPACILLLVSLHKLRLGGNREMGWEEVYFYWFIFPSLVS